MIVDRGPANRARLEAQLARILGNLKVVPDEDTLGPPVRCIRCKDLGVIEWISGEFQQARRRVTATAERPVFTRCECVRGAK